MNGPNPLLEAPLPPTSPPATPGAPSPPFFFYKRMGTPQLAESPPLESARHPPSHVSSRESLRAGDDLSVVSVGDTGSVSEVLSPSEVPISPMGNVELDVEEVTEGDAVRNGLEIVQPDGVEEPSTDRDRLRNGDDGGIATRFQDLNCDGDESGRFLHRKRRRMDRRFKRTFSDQGSDTDPNPADPDDVSPARRLRRKVNPTNACRSPSASPTQRLLFRSGSRPLSTGSDGWTALPFDAADIMDVDSLQLAPAPP